MQFVDVRNDIAFKKIFGNENKKEILMSFLNSLLDISGDREIDDLTILNPWQAPEIPTLKHTMLDIRAIDKRNVTFIVEIQVQSILFNLTMSHYKFVSSLNFMVTILLRILDSWSSQE